MGVDYLKLKIFFYFFKFFFIYLFIFFSNIYQIKLVGSFPLFIRSRGILCWLIPFQNNEDHLAAPIFSTLIH